MSMLELVPERSGFIHMRALANGSTETHFPFVSLTPTGTHTNISNTNYFRPSRPPNIIYLLSAQGRSVLLHSFAGRRASKTIALFHILRVRLSCVDTYMTSAQRLRERRVHSATKFHQCVYGVQVGTKARARTRQVALPTPKRHTQQK